MAMGQQLPLYGPQFFIREDQNLGTELSKCQCAQLHVEMGRSPTGWALTNAVSLSSPLPPAMESEK